MPAWQEVCRLDQIHRDAGVTALVHGHAVAVIRTHEDEVFALSNYDPIAHASVLGRGLVGSQPLDDGQVSFVASPLLKQRYDLRTGRCLDDPSVSVTTYQVRVEDGLVMVGPPRETIEP